MTSLTGRPSSPPLLLTVCAHSRYPFSTAAPSAAKSLLLESEAPMVMGVELVKLFEPLLPEVHALNPARIIITTATMDRDVRVFILKRATASFISLLPLQTAQGMMLPLSVDENIAVNSSDP